MKKQIAHLLVSFLLLGTTSFSYAQTTAKDKKLAEDAQEAKSDFVRVDSLMQSLFDNAYAYAIFPNVGKAGFLFGGAAGNGIVYEQGNVVGKARLRQATIGFQFGGQVYREVLFFETADALTRFKQNNFEFAAQASAVAATAGASANVQYANGVMIFTQQRGGLMYEASIGGQRFEYTPF